MEFFLNLLRSVAYGIIEGVTEWLPISSTGHMILAEQVLKFSFSAEFMEMFRVVIQLGAILAVVVLYFKNCGRSAPTMAGIPVFPAFPLASGASVVQDHCSLRPGCSSRPAAG